MRFKRGFALAVAGTAALGGAGVMAATPAMAKGHDGDSFIGRFSHTSLVASTVPHNGDLNPYGIAVVDHSQGHLVRGDILISNFNNSKNLQGTGSTIVEITPGGRRHVFARITKSSLHGKCPGGIGLTTGLVIVNGWVIVGNLPSKDGSVGTSSAGCLLVIDSSGMVREIFHGHGINGPWDTTAVSKGPLAALFVANVLNGTAAANGKVVHKGTVLRLGLFFPSGKPPVLKTVTTVGSGFAEQGNATAFVFGPTGLGIGHDGTLYVAETQTNQVDAIDNAVFRSNSGGTGSVLTMNGKLLMPLGLTIAPNGDVLTVNGGNGLIVETTPDGDQIDSRFLDKSGSPPGAGALFGLTIAPHEGGVYYVDDAANTLRLLH